MDDLVVNLEAPAPHRIRFGKTNRFTGIALDLSGEPIRRVSALLDGRIAAHTTVDRESPEIGRGLAHVSGAERCRWAIELSVPKDADRLSFEVARAANLPAGIAVSQSSLAPPLEFADARLDLVLAVAVFTHLRLETQRQWVREFRRLLVPGGALLVTLHGEAYARLLDAESRAVLVRNGFLERAGGEEGSNDFATYHAPDFAARLFAGFELAGFFPSGRIGGERVLFRLAALQDILVFWRLP